MIEVETQMEIPVSTRQVWAALVDFESYPRWHPAVAIKGTAAVGEEIEYSFKIAKVPRKIWAKGRINRYSEQSTIGWTFGVRGFFLFEESFSLQQSQNGTQLQHRAKCSGLTPLLARRRMQTSIESMLAESNEGLKRHLLQSQSRSSTRPPKQGQGKRAHPTKKRRQRRTPGPR